VSASNASSTVVTRYANALLDLAVDSKKADKILVDLTELGAMLDGSDDLAAIVISPLIDKSEQQKALLALADKAKFQDLTKNFLGLLAQKGRVSALSAVIRAYQREFAKAQGQISASVTTAQKLSAKQEKDLQASLCEMTGSDVVLDIQVDPSILGGMIVTIGSHMIDSSVSRKLVRLKNAMVSGAQAQAGLGANENPALKEAS